MFTHEHAGSPEVGFVFDRKALFNQLAQQLILHGKIQKPHDPDLYPDHIRTEEDGLSFLLKGIPPLREAGIDEIEYVPEHMFEGDYFSSSVHVRFFDLDLYKSATLSANEETGKVDIDMIIEPKRGGGVIEDKTRDAAIDRAIGNLLTGQKSDDPEVAYHEERIHFMLTADTSPSPADELAIQEVARRLKTWYAS